MTAEKLVCWPGGQWDGRYDMALCPAHTDLRAAANNISREVRLPIWAVNSPHAGAPALAGAQERAEARIDDGEMRLPAALDAEAQWAVSPGTFATWQPRYAEVNIPSFPVVGKRPGVKGYLKIGLNTSRTLASKYGAAEAFGIALNRSKITVLDVDTPDENVFADALSQCGPTPFIVRSGLGNWQAWYRNNGEGRRVRPDASIPVDILGAGYVVAPPSKGGTGAYRIIQGELSDLPTLPVMAPSRWSKSTTYNYTPSSRGEGGLESMAPGERNTGLWRYLMTHAPYCDDADALIDVARTASAAFASPLPDAEVVKTALSVWKCSEGKNWIARGKQVPLPSEPDGLIWVNTNAFVLWKVLRHYNAGRTHFFIANDMAEVMPGIWARKRFTAARKVLLDHGHVVQVRVASTGRAAVYVWGRP